ncbi:MAG TPA: hypothetical protein VHQ01_03285 [Pyrinomonadaceae bacterium]|jgi:hypothetical protein|nr:hypothetical protein [Pyrinomonadaceae bacterium]
MNEVNFNAKTGDCISWPESKKTHKVIDTAPDHVFLSSPSDGDQVETLWPIKYSRLKELEAYFVVTEAYETLGQIEPPKPFLSVMTAEQFDELPAGEPFKTGLIVDSPEGIYMTGSGQMLRFVATKGHANDWAVYVHWSEKSEAYIRENGDKVIGPVNIRRCVPCDEDVFGRYRY